MLLMTDDDNNDNDYAATTIQLTMAMYYMLSLLSLLGTTCVSQLE